MKNLKAKVAIFLSSMFATAVVVAQETSAAMAAAQQGIDQVQTDGLAIQAMIWGPLVAITIGFVIMKLFKKGANRVG